ncbi:UNVERIFIED_CONTAM: Nucleoside diphosphate kinase III, chloroplastic/mitochondrial [Sesamum indicum]
MSSLSVFLLRINLFNCLPNTALIYGNSHIKRTVTLSALLIHSIAICLLLGAQEQSLLLRNEVSDLQIGEVSPLCCLQAHLSFIFWRDLCPVFWKNGGRAAAAAVSCRGRVSSLASYGVFGSGNAYKGWISGVLALPAAVFMLQEQEAHAAEMERTFIAIKPDGVQRGLISEIISRFERKGFKLVAIKVVVPSKDFAKKHYHDLKERPFFNGLCDFLSSGPVIAMVWEGEGVIRYGRKLIGATDPQKSEPGTIRADLAVQVGRNIIHGSDGPETAKDEIKLWFKPDELVNYTSNAEKWIYG